MFGNCEQFKLHVHINTSQQYLVNLKNLITNQKSLL